VIAQLQGGLVYGLTAALYGNISIAKGRVEQSNFHNYRMLRINEMPQIEVHLIKSGEAPGGIGETGTTAAPPALGNALFAATGIRLRRLPIDPRRVVRKETGMSRYYGAGARGDRSRQSQRGPEGSLKQSLRCGPQFTAHRTICAEGEQGTASVQVQIKQAIVRVVVGDRGDIEVHVVSHCERERGEDGSASTAVERSLDSPFGNRCCPESRRDGCCSVLSVRNHVDIGSTQISKLIGQLADAISGAMNIDAVVLPSTCISSSIVPDVSTGIMTGGNSPECSRTQCST